jgi:hypothetical protein
LASDAAQFRTEFEILRGSSASVQAQFSGTQTSVAKLCSELSVVKAWTGAMDSLILSDFPAIFADFKRKSFSLLWRGGRDGFRAKDFHDRCDGHAPTLTVILDKAGNVFGGFTSAAWESRPATNHWKGDTGPSSFLFTLRNPLGAKVPPQTFTIRDEKRSQALCCSSDWGPRFFGISVSPDCTTDNKSYSHLEGYPNNTGLVGNTVFTGSPNFLLKEIEIFEITE